VNPSSIDELLVQATAGNRRALARALTLVESSDEFTTAVHDKLLVSGKNSFIIGLTGAPGAGKSTLAGALIRLLRARDLRVAVLAVDPSSPFSAGALLGDRLRMAPRERDHGVYIRSMASRGHSGGLATATLAACALLSASDWPLIIIETVGVGQAETDIAGAADTTVVVVNPGWGDQVQAHKAGLMEIGDVFALNKADRPGMAETRADLEHLLATRPPSSGPTSIVETIATEDQGIEALWEQIEAHHHRTMPDAQQQRHTRIKQALQLGIQSRLDARRSLLVSSFEFGEAVDTIAAGEQSLSDALGKLLARKHD
jgi:LAO/AO transport system kinase